MGITSIAWTDRSINPIRACDRKTGKVGHHCEKVSDGCKNCYASALQKRFGLPEFSGPSRRETVEHFLDIDRLREVLRRKKPTKFFWADMTDLFGEWVSDDWLDLCFATMALTHRHTHQVLTKRPERMREYVAGLSRNYDRLEAAARSLGYSIRFEYEGKVIPLVPWPIPSAWLGVSVENQKAANERIPILLQTPAAVRFLSCEPLLERIDLNLDHECGDTPHGRCPPIPDWVICGGESGPNRRDCRVEWMQSIYDQCRAAGVAYFQKQDSGPRPGMQGRIPLDLWNVKEFPTVEGC